MQIVIDANAVIAILIKPGKPIEVFFSEELELYAPETLLFELKKYEKLIKAKTNLQQNELEEFISIIKKRIIFIPEKQFLENRKDAEKTSPDPKDVPYFALALYLNSPIWSNDKKIKEQTIVTVYATHELLNLLK